MPIPPIARNKMSEYASATYAFRLYTIPYEERKVIRSLGGISMQSIASKFSTIGIISESAVTPTQINNLNLTSAGNGRGSTITNVSFDMVEPRNSTIIEQLYMTAVTLGWDRPDAGVLILEVRFLGRTDVNDTERSIETISIPIVFRSVEVSLDQSSSTYHVAATPYGTHNAQEFTGQAIPETISVDAGNNLGDFFNNLAVVLNDKEEAQVDNNAISMAKIVHSFDIPDEYKSLEISNASSGTQTSSNKTFEEYNAAENTLTFTINTTIFSIVDTVLKNCDEIEEDLMTGDATPMMHEIYPDVMYTNYDSSAEAYQNDIIWRVIKVPVITDFTKARDKNAYYKIISDHTKVLKLYEYYFTGENTEVRGLTWHKNNLYRAKIGVYHQLTSRNNNNRTTTGQHNHETLDSDIEQESIENTPNNSWASTATMNELGENVFYTSDMDIVGVDFVQGQPRTIINMSNADNSPTDIDSGRRATEYLNQLSHIRNQGSATNINSAYLNIELKIKGDPYWLLTRNGSQIDNATGANSVSTSLVPILAVQFFHPSDEYYQGGSFASAKQYSAFTGFYNILKINTTFNNGRFEQVLTGIRLNIKPSEAEDIIQEAKNNERGSEE